VLVVDDEAPLRAVQRRILEQDGYTVIEAASGAEGIERLAGDVVVHLLIVDLHMPVLRGDEMVRRIRLDRPDVPVLYVTGQIDRLMDERPLDDREAFLEKPFTSAGLREAVSLRIHGTTGKAPIPHA
jgi:two-component system cell cycle sensor histidine kinase/response regulator CckA